MSDTPFCLSVESVDAALRLLTVVRDEGGIDLEDATERLGADPSTAQRLLRTMCAHGFLTRDDGDVYRPGRVLSTTATPAFFDLCRTVRPHLAALSARVGENVRLMVLDGCNVRFVDGTGNADLLEVGSRLGASLPAHTTSGGKALLAELSAEELRARYPYGLPATPGAAIADLDTLERHLQSVRKHGYAISFDESERGVTAVGMCVRDSGGRVVAAITITVPSVRCAAPRIPELAEALAATVGDLRRQL